MGLLLLLLASWTSTGHGLSEEYTSVSRFNFSQYVGIQEERNLLVLTTASLPVMLNEARFLLVLFREFPRPVVMAAEWVMLTCVWGWARGQSFIYYRTPKNTSLMFSKNHLGAITPNFQMRILRSRQFKSTLPDTMLALGFIRDSCDPPKARSQALPADVFTVLSLSFLLCETGTNVMATLDDWED